MVLFKLTFPFRITGARRPCDSGFVFSFLFVLFIKLCCARWSKSDYFPRVRHSKIKRFEADILLSVVTDQKNSHTTREPTPW